MLPQGMAQAVVEPPRNPDECIFARMSANYTADLRTTVEPCVFGGDPDCTQCGCSISTALHWIAVKKFAGVLRAAWYARPWVWGRRFGGSRGKPAPPDGSRPGPGWCKLDPRPKPLTALHEQARVY